MDEKKTLSDETLKDVSGGTYAINYRKLEYFVGNNCASCSFDQLMHGCPYGGKVYAFQELGEDGICPKKEAM